MRNQISFAAPVLAVLAIACGGSPDQAESIGSTDSALAFNLPNAAQLSVVAASQKVFDFHGRNTCLNEAGSAPVSQNGIANGQPTTMPDGGYNCVESGHTGDTKGVIYTDVDNPRIFTHTTLTPVNSSGGMVQQQYSSTPNGFTFTNGDLSVQVTGGSGPVGAEASIFGSVSGTLLPMNPQGGQWGVPGAFELVTVAEGMRVGRTPLTAQEMTTLPNRTTQMAAFPVTVQLDPSVILVPIQVIRFYSDAAGAAPPNFVGRELARWDRVPASINDEFDNDVGPENTEIAQMVHEVTGFEVGGEKGPDQADLYGWLPDDIWAPCGVQFRMTSYLEVPAPQSIMAPEGHETIDGAVYDMADMITQLPDYDPNALTVVLAPYCSDVDSNGGGFLPPAGASIISQHLSCVATSQGTSNTAAHEVGHVIMNNPEHPDCSKPPFGDLENVMCAYDGGSQVTQTQCKGARNVLGTAEWAQRFRPLNKYATAPYQSWQAPALVK